MVPMISREHATEEEWSAWWRANYKLVQARRTISLSFPPGTEPRLLRRNCPVCGDLYLTSTSEREATCGDCLFNANDYARESQRSINERVAKLRRDHEWAVQAHLGGDCDHEGREGFGPQCYLQIFPSA
jgi:hypothetical protein